MERSTEAASPAPTAGGDLSTGAEAPEAAGLEASFD
jgi:hypothetical protein